MNHTEQARNAVFIVIECVNDVTIITNYVKLVAVITPTFTYINYMICRIQLKLLVAERGNDPTIF